MVLTMRRLRIVVSVAALTAVGWPDASAQAQGFSVFVAGVADAETGEPLEGAEVILPRSLRIGQANALGEVTLANVPHGVQRVRVRRLGYSPVEVDLAMSGDTTGAVFRLRRIATPLGEVRIEAEWMPPRMKDVLTRRKQGIGRFLEEKELARVGSQQFIDVVRFRFPGLFAVPDSLNPRKHVLMSSRSLKPCSLPTYLDDMYIPPDELELIRTWDLAVVEYYSASQVPARYLTRGLGCGVLLAWSKWY